MEMNGDVEVMNGKYYIKSEDYFLGFKRNKFNYIGLFLTALFLVFSYWVSHNSRYEVNWNLTESLPYHLFIIDKNKIPQKNEMGAFNFYEEVPVDANNSLKGTKTERVTFIKIVGGISGDVVSVDNRTVYINSQPVGYVKEQAQLDHRKLYPLTDIGVIPSGKYYFQSPHPDSYDSRYSEIGLIDEVEVRGKAYGIF